jgi:glucose-6-phosphate isomerase
MLTLDDTNMFRPALDQVHGLSPEVGPMLAERFAEVQAAVRRFRAAGEYGFMTLGVQEALVAELEAFAAARHRTFDHLLILGIGGSALGMRALLTALRPAAWNEWPADRRDGWPTVTILENVDPMTVAATLDRLDPRRTLVNVISKSGGTAETLAQYLIVRGWLEQAVGATALRYHVIVTTDPERGPLRALVREEGFTSFEVPPAIGGRFSVLTAVGLLPAALVGLDIRALVAGAADALQAAESDVLADNLPARWAGLQWQAQLTRAANIHVLMPYSDRLRDTAEWFRQLWAESLGKQHDRSGAEVFRGPTPLAAIGATDQHSQVQLFMEGPFDKTITFIRTADTMQMVPIPGEQRTENREPRLPGSASPLEYLPGHTLGQLLDAEFLATREALRQRGRMNMTLTLEAVGPRELGHLLMFFQLATGYAGVWYDVNPFDQPGVELGKDLTRAAMAEN